MVNTNDDAGPNGEPGRRAGPRKRSITMIRTTTRSEKLEGARNSIFLQKKKNYDFGSDVGLQII